MLENKRILAIDDDTLIREYLRIVLTRQGANVVTASTGGEGLTTWEGPTNFDLILLDLVLPDLDGVEVLKRIREKDTGVTIVILTGAGNVQSAISATRNGADAYIQKQDISLNSDPAALFYNLEQGFERRAGLVAQQQLEGVRSDLYAIVTHDLRSPASVIQTSAEMLLSGEFGSLAPEQANLIQIISKSAIKMNALISDYLDFAQIDAGFLRLRLEAVDLRELVQNAVEAVRFQAQAKRHAIVVDLLPEPLQGQLDPERIQQVLDNLLTNAIKYTPDGGSITLRLRKEKGDAVIEVSDNGIGMAAENLPSLFTKYHRVPGPAGKTIRGTGLGLLIVKEIVEAHGGTVSAGSPGLDEGSTFTVRLPLKARTGTRSLT